MAPTAQLALRDFVRVAGEEGCTLYFEQFLRDGFSAWPSHLQSRYPGLRSWAGLAELKAALAEFAGLPSDSPPLLAGRSANLAKLAARQLFRKGGTVLVTDLIWPSYADILQRTARKVKGQIEYFRIRARILRREISPRQLIETMMDRFLSKRCTGLMFPHVSHDGICLPATEIVRVFRQETSNSFIAIDGSQAVGQLPLRLSELPCDFYLAGCHKWLGSYLPLGVGFCPNEATQSEIQSACVKYLARGTLDDPLLAFLHGLETGKLRRFTETVNVSPLFALRGALQDHGPEEATYDLHHRRTAIAEMVARIGHMTGWSPLLPNEGFRSAAVLLQATCPEVRRWSTQVLRERFHELGIALTCYRGGILRLSAPSKPFTTHEAGMLINALALVQLRARQCSQRARLVYA
ncbi:MAG: aminotransferase class V-fold PLP-dependent enzyme [Gemmataceae bacterium]|nr:aminotransferase class V-fold PLP-dependent enzyme [Gemmataceae bacterium]